MSNFRPLHPSYIKTSFKGIFLYIIELSPKFYPIYHLPRYLSKKRKLHPSKNSKISYLKNSLNFLHRHRAISKIYETTLIKPIPSLLGSHRPHHRHIQLPASGHFQRVKRTPSCYVYISNKKPPKLEKISLPLCNRIFS